MSLIDNRPLLLTEIAERWSKDGCAGSADRILSDLIKTIWRGEFSEGALLVDPRRLLDCLFPDGHVENVEDAFDQTITPGYLAECLMDAPGFWPDCSLGQALNDVLYGRSKVVDAEPSQDPPSHPAVLARFSIEDYSPGQRKVIECLRLTPDGLATWLRREAPPQKQPSPPLGVGVPVSAITIEAEGAADSSIKLTAEEHLAEASKRKPLSMAESRDWYLRRIDESSTRGIIPSRADDEQQGKAVGIPTTRVRSMRAELAPAAWRQRGRRKVARKTDN